ncbi:PREDICTED: protein monoglycylase TTLL8 [Myotis brandtii]|uniref:protein monoglycylase TTLL8 n=1 Tax=Myotis brandtii TaxID=109478 RepID=UPI0007045737|nr:PREDICTED: protein monoglycylase TTLL8 [Myotis brandtii]
MEPGERKRLLSASSLEGDWREENKLKRGDSSASPKLDRYKMARQLTEKAIKDKKIFSIHGHYPVVRALLRRKGWVEKKLHFLPRISVSADGEGEGAAESKRPESKESQEAAFEETDDIHDVMSRLVRNEVPYFLWTIKRDSIDYHSLSGDQMLNHFGRTASLRVPGCRSLCPRVTLSVSPDDFRRTAASSILKWVVSHQHCPKSHAQSRPKEAQDSDPGSQKGVCSGCQRGLKTQVYIRGPSVHAPRPGAASLLRSPSTALRPSVLSAFCSGKAFISNPRNHFSQCQALLNRISSASPQTEIDGLRNIWIVKPAAKSRGRDIVCMNRVEEILELVASDNLLAKDKWVVQKYIETPLLIYDTKFDIRQWFLVTDWNPLTIWFYKESYLRFSTRRFSLDDLDGAIHLCNNSIQKHLKIDKGRSPLLPYHNMWTSARFQEYLQKRGRGSVWGSVIYPAMKQAIANTMKVAQDHVEPRKSSFELYGADFILGHDFKPWLIEINSSPTMHASTPVTAQLCAQVQEDTIKVVLDRKGDRSCDVGTSSCSVCCGPAAGLRV